MVDFFVPGAEMIQLGLSLQQYYLLAGFCVCLIGIWLGLVFYKYGWQGGIAGLLLLPMITFGAIVWPLFLLVILLTLIGKSWKKKFFYIGLTMGFVAAVGLVFALKGLPDQEIESLTPAAMEKTINMRMGEEFTQVGENILPLPIRRMAMNKLYLPFYQLSRRAVSTLDLEAWFFAYNMQQNLVWREGLIEKQVFAGFDWLIFILMAIYVIVGKTKKDILFGFVVLILLGFIVGKQYINLVFLLSLPVVFRSLLGAMRVVFEKKFILGLVIFLGIISVTTRMNLLINHQMIWLDNRILAYKFIVDNTKNLNEHVLVSSSFGPAQEYVSFFKGSSNASFGLLPLADVADWPAGVYAGLVEEFVNLDRKDNGLRVVASKTIRDSLTQSGSKEVIVIEKFTDE